MLYFYLDNGSNVCGLEFNYKNGEEEGDSSLKEEKEDKKLEEGEETKQYKMEGLGENGDNKSLLADKQTSKQTKNWRGGRGGNEGGEEDPLTNMGEGKRARVSWEEVRYSCEICKKLFTSDMNLHLHI